MFSKRKNDVGKLAQSTEPVKEAGAEVPAGISQKATQMAKGISKGAAHMSEVIRTKSAVGLSAVSSQLEEGSSYLAKHEFSEMASHVIHRYPVQSVSVGLGLGLLAGSWLAPHK